MALGTLRTLEVLSSTPLKNLQDRSLRHGAKATSKAISSIMLASPTIVKVSYKYLSQLGIMGNKHRLRLSNDDPPQPTGKIRAPEFLEDSSGSKELGPGVLQVVDGVAVDVVDQVHWHLVLEQIPLVACAPWETPSPGQRWPSLLAFDLYLGRV